MSKIRASARGQSCTLRFYPGCDPETVVLCHVHPPGQGKVGGKVSDLWSLYGCDRCHAVIDRRDMQGRREIGEAMVWQRVLAGHLETLDRLVEAGLVKVGGR